MATGIGAKEKDVAKLLQDLVCLDFDAIEAYEAAIARLETAGDQQQLSRFRDDHVEHTRNLGAILRKMGKEPPTQGDFKRMLTKGKVLLGGLIGDRAVLLAMKDNEEDTNKAYERALGHEGVTGEVADAIAKNLSDERRHKAWIEERLGRMREERARHAHP